MADGQTPPAGVTLDAQPQGPPPGVTLDPPTQQTSAAATPDAQPQQGPPPGVTLDDQPQSGDLQDYLDNAPPTPPDRSFEAGLHHLWTPEDVEGAKGFIKSAGQTAATVAGWLPGQTAARAADYLKQHTQIRNDDQQSGADLENVVEFLGGDELLKGASLLTKMNELKPIAAALEKAPVATRILGNAIRLGTVGGAQTIAHGGTVEQAVQNALLNAGGSAILEGGINALGFNPEGGLPGTRNIAGADFQTDPSGDLLLHDTEGDRFRQDPATQAVDLAQGNMAREALVNSAERYNSSLAPAAQAIQDPTRLLPGQAGFSVQTAPEPVPTGEGQIAFDPRKRQTGFRVVEGKGSATTPTPGTPYPSDISPTYPRAELGAPPDLSATPPQTRTIYHKEPIFQYFSDVRPGQPAPAADTMTGGGVMRGLSPEEARAQLGRYERILGDNAQTSDMGARQTQQIADAHADLAGQLDRYDDWAAAQPHFPQLDAQAALRNTHSLEDTANILKGHAGALWRNADAVSGNEFSTLRNEEKGLRKQIYNGTGDYRTLQQRLARNQADQVNFLNQYRTTVSPEEKRALIGMYQDGIVLQNYHDLWQKQFNAITQPEEARAMASGGTLKRVFQPTNFTQQLENFYNGGIEETNRSVLQRTIGTPMMDSAKEISEGFQSATRRKATQGLISNIVSSVRHHTHGLRGMLAGATTGAGAGAIVAHELGKSLLHGIGAGAATVSLPVATGTIAGIRGYVTDELLANPNYAKRFMYAVKNGIPPRTAAPLLSSFLIGQQQQDQRAQ